MPFEMKLREHAALKRPHEDFPLSDFPRFSGNFVSEYFSDLRCIPEDTRARSVALPLSLEEGVAATPGLCHLVACHFCLMAAL